MKYPLLSLLILPLIFSLGVVNKVHATLLVWDFEFEVTYVGIGSDYTDTVNTSVGDIISATLSYDDEVLSINDGGYVTSYEITNGFIDMSTLTSDGWANTGALDLDISTVEQSTRDIVKAEASYFDNLVSNIYYESLDFRFYDYVINYTQLPTNWDTTTNDIDFSYYRDLTSAGQDDALYVSGNLVSVAFSTISVPEPSGLAIFSLGLFRLCFANKKKFS